MKLSIFHVFALVGLVLGASLGAWDGAVRFGVLGSFLGAMAVGAIGLVVGRLPEMMMSRRAVRHLGAKSSEELRVYLHSSGCVMPNYVLVELLIRGEDVQPEIPVILDMLVSTDICCRARGWAALNSAFPELVEQISDYRINDSIVECQKKTGPLRPGLIHHEQPVG